MWTSAGPGQWSRPEGYLLADGELMLELHGDTLHIYRKDPKADPGTFTGGPLDGYTWQSTGPVGATSPSPSAPIVVDAPTAWRVLGDRAAQVDAAAQVVNRRPPASGPNR